MRLKGELSEGRLLQWTETYGNLNSNVDVARVVVQFKNLQDHSHYEKK